MIALDEELSDELLDKLQKSKTCSDVLFFFKRERDTMREREQCLKSGSIPNK